MVTKRVRVSLLEVARHAGVSPATVSRVMNNSAPVSESIRSKVVLSAEELGYDITPVRSSAATTRTIAVIVADLLNPFFPELLRGVDLEARQDGTGLLLYDTGEDTQPEEHMLRMVTRPQPGRGNCRRVAYFHGRFSGALQAVQHSAGGDQPQHAVLPGGGLHPGGL